MVWPYANHHRLTGSPEIKENATQSMMMSTVPAIVSPQEISVRQIIFGALDIFVKIGAP